MILTTVPFYQNTLYKNAISNKEMSQIRTLSTCFLCLIVAIFCPLASMAQTGTTMEEYRYLTKGYGYQHEMGLDHNKEGYSLKTLYQMEDKTSFVGMFKERKESPSALLLILDPSKPTPTYLCIPNESATKEVIALYDNDRNKLSYDKKKKVDKAIRSFLFHQMKREMIPVSYEMEVTPKIAEIHTTSSAPTVKESTSTAPILLDKVFSKGLSEKESNSTVQKTDLNITQNSTIESLSNKSGVQTKVNKALANRTIINKGLISEPYNSFGTVSVKVCVDAAGDITTAKFTQKGSTTLNEQLKKIAVTTALKYQFAISNEPEQCGIISFHFAP